VAAEVVHITPTQVAMAAQVHLVHTALHQLAMAQIDKTNTQAELVVLDQAAT
jgi:hypothetical protein